MGRKVLPAIRATIATKLSEKGFSGREIAKIMGVSPTAVTYYIHKARGKYKITDRKVEKELEKFANALAKGNLTEEEKTQELCKICRLTRGIAK